ncbi:MAG: DM13 domain-containing protein [Chloroflexi bacterium]|nr:DM13 domain-containing protein [Chloroflexota bacterium]
MSEQSSAVPSRSRLIIIVGIVVAIVVVAVGWWFISPLIINVTVDDAFPFEVPPQATLDAMSAAAVQDLRSELEAAIPSEATLAALPEATLMAVGTAVMEAAAAMPDVMMDEAMPAEMPAEPVVLASGMFQDADSFHRGSGSATIYELPDGGGQLLRFEDFSVTNGPDLHVLLATGAAPTNQRDLGEYIDLGQLRGNMGNQNYEIPAGTVLDDYQSVVIYCLPFRVVFAIAPLG